MSLYPVAGAVLVLVGIVMLLTGRYVWSLPMFGGALALYFIAKSIEAHSDGDDGRG